MSSDAIWDAFISYASEDKQEVAKPLAEELIMLGLKVWYDEFELKIGDSLSGSINRGLSLSNYGIVIFSKSYFQKSWTIHELDALLTREVNLKKKLFYLSATIYQTRKYKDIIL